MGAPEPGTPGAGDRQEAPHRPEPLLQSLQSIWRELPGLLSDRVELLTLELQRAGSALVQVVVAIIAAAILGVTAWLVLWAGIAALLVSLGWPLAAALLVVLIVNVGVAWFAVLRAKRLLPRISLPATRRHLTLTPSPRETAPPVPSPPAPSHHERDHFAPAGQPAAR